MARSGGSTGRAAPRPRPHRNFLKPLAQTSPADLVAAYELLGSHLADDLDG